MKKFKRMLAGLACVLAVCLCTPTAFAAKVIVYFDANGGICTSAAERTNDEGKLGSLPGASMEGYTFDGWYTSGTDDVTGFPIDVQVKANDTAFGADTTIYAHWSANGGICTSAAERTNADGQLTSLPTATMEGYTFDGWYTTGTDDVTGFPIDVQVKTNDTAFGADTTVYAHWSANGGSAEVVEEKEVDPDTLLTTMGLAAGSVVLVLLASLAL